MPATPPTTIVTTEASTPKIPPVNQSGPEKTGCSRPGVAARPETAEAKIPCCVKFQAKWIPIGSHRRPVTHKGGCQGDPARKHDGDGAENRGVWIEEVIPTEDHRG